MSVYSKNALNTANQNEAWSKIFKFVKPGSRILDVGCSSGKLGAALRQEKNAYVVGLDLDSADVKLAKNNLDEAHVLNIEQDAIDHLGKFDIVIMADVIEHLLNPVTTLIKVKGLLGPKGELIFSIPNMANATIRVELLKGHFEYRDWGLLDRTHLHYYDQQEVNRVFQAAAYDVVQTDCTIRNIPKDILRKELEPIGIQVADKLVKFLNSPEALTYQFIGRAVPAIRPKKFVATTSSSLDSITREIDAIQAQMKAKEKEARTLKKALKVEQARAAMLEERLGTILGSKSWILLQKAHTVKRKIKRQKNS